MKKNYDTEIASNDGVDLSHGRCANFARRDLPRRYFVRSILNVLDLV
jgi:hypothetical protein